MGEFYLVGMPNIDTGFIMADSRPIFLVYLAKQWLMLIIMLPLASYLFANCHLKFCKAVLKNSASLHPSQIYTQKTKFSFNRPKLVLIMVNYKYAIKN